MNQKYWSFTIIFNAPIYNQWFYLKAQANYVEFHPSGTCIAAGLANGVVKIYETRMKKVLQLYEIHTGSVKSVSFHPSGNYLVTGSQEGSLKGNG